MTSLALWSLALALGLSGWVAIVAALGPWFAGALAALFLVWLCSVWQAGGVTPTARAIAALERPDRGQ